MKLLRLCVFACFAGLALSVVGCGGEPPAADVTANSSALYSFGPNDKNVGFGYLWCAHQGFHIPFGSRMTVVPQSWGGIYAADTYAVYFSKNSNDYISLASSAIPLHTSMDGSYHILTNDVGGGVAGMQEPNEASYTTPDGLWVAHPVEIPTNGIVIYAAGERTDFPNGVAFVTLDPNSNVESPPVPENGRGRCSYRQTFTVPL